MPQNILIATLGEHPAVVTGMVKALHEIAQIKIDALYVLHNNQKESYSGKKGFDLIDRHLSNVCRVYSHPLPFADPTDETSSRQFLHSLADLVERQQMGNTIYLSLAGGRKNMSALMALITQFFPSIKKLYHLIDKYEGSKKPTFHSLEYIEGYVPPVVAEHTLNPPLENLKLVEIPCPGFATGVDNLWQLLQSGKAITDYPAKFRAWYGALGEKDAYSPPPKPNAKLADKWILLVPLGRSPMVVTQSYTLLQAEANVEQVAVLHTTHAQVINGLDILKRQFKRKNVAFKSYRVKIDDVDSKEHCKQYIVALRQTIADLRQQCPDHQIALSLSGGRKGMSALTLFAAQYEGITQVYHTLINEVALEQQVEDEGSVAHLNTLPKDDNRAKILFLDNYDKDKFNLFSIPLIELEPLPQA